MRVYTYCIGMPVQIVQAVYSRLMGPCWPHRRENAIRRHKLYRSFFQCVTQAFLVCIISWKYLPQGQEPVFFCPQETEKAILPAIFIAKCQFRMTKWQNSQVATPLWRPITRSLP